MPDADVDRVSCDGTGRAHRGRYWHQQHLAKTRVPRVLVKNATLLTTFSW